MDQPVNIDGYAASLDLSSARVGIYVLEVQTEGGMIKKKLVFQK
jgi:hypothetical protein